jgi:hypothetical protein
MKEKKRLDHTFCICKKYLLITIEFRNRNYLHFYILPMGRIREMNAQVSIGNDQQEKKKGE